MPQSILTSLALDDWFEAYQPQATSQYPTTSPKPHPHPLRSHSKDLKYSPEPERRPGSPNSCVVPVLRADDAGLGNTINPVAGVDIPPLPIYHTRGRSNVSRQSITCSSNHKDFPTVPTRPPLRPSTSCGDSPMSPYYSYASAELDQKSIKVTAKEVFDEQQCNPSARRFYCCCIVLSLMNFMSGLNTTSLVTALPTMSQDLGAGPVSTFWIVIASILTAALCQPLFTRLSTVGSKSLLAVGFSLVISGSLLSALTRSTGIIITGRSIEGCGNAAVRVLTQLILRQLITNDISRGCENWIPATFWLGTAVGPIVGSAFTNNSWTKGWQYIFYVNIPFALVGSVAIPLLVKLPESSESTWQRMKKVDVLGWTLLSAAWTLIILAISWAGSVHTWSSWSVVVPLLVGVATLVTWAVHSGYGNHPILPMSCFTRAGAILPCIGTMIHGMLLTAILYMVAIYFQSGLLSTPQSSGSYLLSWTIPFFVVAVAASFALPISKHHLATGLGWILATIGLVLMTILTSHTSAVLAIPVGILTGAALGLLALLLRTAVRSSATTDDETINAGPTHSFFSALGMCLGLAVAGSIYLNKRAQGQDVASSLRTVWIVLTVFSSTALALSILSAVRVHKTPGLIALRLVSA